MENISDYLGGVNTTIEGTAFTAEQISAPMPNQEFLADDVEYLKKMEGEYDRLQEDLSTQIQTIADTPMEVDGDALVGTIQESFEKTKGRIVESALAGVKKTGMEMDAYFGSATGDQRSGARIQMAAATKNSMMQGAFQAIAGLYDKNTADIVSTTLEAAKINISGAGEKMKGIANFTGQAVQLYLGTLGAASDRYVGKLNASIQWAGVLAKGFSIESQERSADLNAAVKLLTSKQYGIRGFMAYGLPTVADPTISTVAHDINLHHQFWGSHNIQRSEDAGEGTKLNVTITRP